MTKVKTEGYRNVRVILGRCYLFTGFLSNEDITNKIVHVGLLRNNTKTITSMLIVKTLKVHIECVIYLSDKRKIEIETKDIRLIKFLIDYMHVSNK